jgi:hypothetical protein
VLPIWWSSARAASRVKSTKSTSVLKVVARFGSLGGTNTADAVRRHFRRHDRVVIVADEQAWGGYHGPGAGLYLEPR